MKRAVLVPTTDDRREVFDAFLESCKAHLPDDLDVFAVAQGNERAVWRDLSHIDRVADFLVLPERVGAYVARRTGLRTWRAQVDTWISVDDDQLLIEQTDYETACEIAERHRHIGLLSTGWAKSRSSMGRIKLDGKLIKQPIVYTGGGLVIAPRAVECVLDWRGRPAIFDNIEFSLATYLAGLENYRWRGSIALHVACSSGGRRAWLKRTQGELPDPLWIRCEQLPGTMYRRHGFNNDYRIPDSSDLTPEAKQIHGQAVAQRG